MTNSIEDLKKKVVDYLKEIEENKKLIIDKELEYREFDYENEKYATQIRSMKMKISNLEMEIAQNEQIILEMKTMTDKNIKLGEISDNEIKDYTKRGNVGDEEINRVESLVKSLHSSIELNESATMSAMKKFQFNNKSIHEAQSNLIKIEKYIARREKERDDLAASFKKFQLSEESQSHAQHSDSVAMQNLLNELAEAEKRAELSEQEVELRQNHLAKLKEKIQVYKNSHRQSANQLSKIFEQIRGNSSATPMTAN